MSTDDLYVLAVTPHIQRLASYRSYTDTSDPHFVLVVNRDTYIREVSADGMPSTTRPSFFGRHKTSFTSDITGFLAHDLSEAAVREVLSFPGYDLYPACGQEILSRVRGAVESGELKVVATVSCVVDVYDEGLAVALAEERSEEEGSRKRRKVAPAETVLEEGEWEGRVDGDGSTCTCTVCLEEFGTGEKVARMPCSHCFHKECIRKWLVEGSNSCPLCRFEVE